MAAKAVTRSGENRNTVAEAMMMNQPPNTVAVVRAASPMTVGRAASTRNLETSRTSRVEDTAVMATRTGEGSRRRDPITSSPTSMPLERSRYAYRLVLGFREMTREDGGFGDRKAREISRRRSRDTESSSRELRIVSIDTSGKCGDSRWSYSRLVVKR